MPPSNAHSVASLVRRLDARVEESAERVDLGSTVEALSAVLGGASSLHTNAADEALAKIPDVLDDDAYEILWIAAIEAEAARIAYMMREQHIVPLSRQAVDDLEL